jgi:MoaA/NifB/PqqE/SkfB family radical SAM enzyme
MQFELTNYCNLRCPVCPTGSRWLNRHPESMPVELFRQVLEEVGPYLLTMSLWGWGEPLLHPKLSEILAAAAQHRVFSLLSTNGQNLDQPKVQEALIRFPPDHLIVALDGLTDKSNSRFRIGARLEPALTGVRQLAEAKRLLKARKPVLHMRYIVMKHNRHELPRLVEFAKKADFDFLSFRNLCSIGSDDGLRAVNPFLSENDLHRGLLSPGGQDKKGDKFLCYEPFWFPALFSDGTLAPCDQDFNGEVAMGKVEINHPGSFRQIWNGIPSRNIRKTIKQNPGSITCCRYCFFENRPGTQEQMEPLVLNPEIQIPFVK